MTADLADLNAALAKTYDTYIAALDAADAARDAYRAAHDAYDAARVSHTKGHAP